ncbi:MAG: hypothetical protein WC208_10530 [Gallionella sp.]|jgi:hypothetical protein
MAHKTTVQWRQGETGSGATYTFSPNPSSITRHFPGQRKAEIFIPNLDGSIIQTMGDNSRKVTLQGVIYVYPSDYDSLMTVRDNLEIGIGNDIGQLHIWSATKHIYYKGILDGDIEWGEQKNMCFLEYTIKIICADPVEYVVP